MDAGPLFKQALSGASNENLIGLNFKIMLLEKVYPAKGAAMVTRTEYNLMKVEDCSFIQAILSSVSFDESTSIF